MAEITVNAEERTALGKNANYRLRVTGRIPAVVYGQGIESLSISLDPRDLDRILHSETGHNTIFKLKMGADSKAVLIKDYQLDPVKGHLIHADLQAVIMDRMMVFEVPVQPVGNSKGVKAGGILDIVIREIELECLPGDVPDHIRVDVSELDIGDSIRVKGLPIDTAKVKVLSEPELVVLTVVAPHVEAEPEEAAAAAAPEEMAEPELIKRGKEEEEEEEAEQE